MNNNKKHILRTKSAR